VRHGAEEGDGFGRVPGAVAGWVHNGFHPRRREANVWGPRDTGAHLAASRGSRRCRPASHAGLGSGRHRAGPAAEKWPTMIFSILNSFPIE
jgi:hypothetical protein